MSQSSSVDLGRTPEDVAAAAASADKGDVKFESGNGAVHMQADPDAVVDDGPQLPEGGYDKFFNKTTGEYNWEAHAKEQAFKLAKQDEKPANEPAKSDTKTEETPDTKTENSDDQAAKDAANAAGVDVDAFNAYVMEHGEPSAEDLAKFEKAGISEEIVRDYVDMKLEKIDSFVSTVHEFFGGEEAFGAMSKWAGEHYNQAELKAINEGIVDPAKWQMIARTIKADMASANPQKGQPAFGTGQARPSQGGAPSNSEPLTDAGLQTIISSPQWKRDPNLRRETIARAKAAGLMHNTALSRFHSH